MGIEPHIKVAEARLHAALVAGQDTGALRAELVRLRTDLAQQRAVAVHAASSSERTAREAAAATIQRDVARIAAEAAVRLKAFLAPFSTEDLQ